MLLGLVPPDAGRASLDGRPLIGDGLQVRRRAAYMPGEIGLYGERSGRSHLAWLVGGRGRSALARAVQLAERLELPLGKRVRGYSHGMKRQLLLAAALAPEVRVRILDEPTEGLDPTRRALALELLAEDAARGTTILLSSHHLGEVERICRRVLFLRRGQLLDESEARELYARARRVLRLGFAVTPGPQALQALQALGATELRVEDDRVGLLLPDGEPRAALRRVLDEPRLPGLRSLSFGELSLQELYRSIYGREGV
jgi:ABC-2 type transport system ATP-binding protein